MASEINLDQLHSLFELSSELMAVLTEDGSFSQTNPAWQKSLGFTPRDLKDSAYFDLLHPEDLSRVQLEIQKLHQGTRRVEFTGRCRGRDKGYRWVRWTCQFLKDERVFFLTGQDITDLKEAEKALAENQAKFQRLSESATEGVCIHENGLVLEVNQAFARILGFQSPEEVVGKNGLDFVAPEYRQLAINQIRTGSEEPYEIIGVRRDGARFYCQVQGKAIQYHGKAVRVTTFQDVTRARKREQELFESQDLFRKLTEAARDGVAVSEKGVVLIANPALARMFGLEVSEMIGRNALEFTAPEFRETLLKKVLDEVETSYEVMGLRKDGSRFPVEISPRMTTYQGRRVRVAFFHDITQRKKIEEEVLRQKDFSQNLINSSIDGLLAFDLECRYTLWNPAMERISGHSREEVLGQCAFDVFPFLKQIGEDHHFYEALEGRTSVTQDRPYRTPAGRQGHFAASYSPLKNSRGEIIGGLGIVHETSERKRVQEALQESETNLRAVFHNTFQNIVLMDREGRIKAFNPNAAAAILEETGKGLEVGKDLAEYFHPENVKFFRKNLKQVLDGEAVQLERPLPVADGEVHWFEVNYHPVFGAGGEIEGVCLTSIDIDESKRAREALQKSAADLRAVFNSSSRGFILAGRNGRIQDFNHLALEGVRRMRGQELEVGRSLLDYIETEHVKAFRERFKKILQGETLHLERVVKAPSGREEWFEFTYNPVSDPQGRVIGVCVALGSIQARKKAAEALEKSESQLRTLFNSVRQAIVLMDSHGAIQNFNKPAAEMFLAATGKEFKAGAPFLDYVREGDRDEAQGRLDRVGRGETVHLERPYRFADGNQHWVEFTYHPVADPTGAIVGTCFISQSIDDRKKAEEALRDSEEKFRRLFESAPLGMTLVDKDFRFLHVNRAFCGMIGYEPGDLVGKKFSDITHPEDLRQNAALPGELAKGRGFRIQKRYLHKEGRIVWANLTVQSFLSAQGEYLYSLGMAEDITEHKNAEEALQKSEADLKAVFNSGSQVVVLIGPDGNIQNFNASADFMARRVLGGPLQKGTPFIKTLPPGADPEVFTASFQAALEGRESQGERCIRSAEGKERWVEVKYQPVLNSQGAVQGACFSLSFIDERKKAEEALRESQERFQRFTELTQEGILIHENSTVTDVNPALAGMMGYPAGEMIGKNGFDFLAPESREEARRRMRENSAAPYEVLALRKDGSTFPAELHGRNYQDKGRTLRVMTVRDLTWQKAAERILTESEERYRKLVELLPEAIVVHAAGRILYVNSTGLKMFAATPEQMDGGSLAEFLHPDHREEALRRVQETLQTGRPTEWIEQKLIRKDGGGFEAETKGTPILYQGIPAVMTIVRDITERKKAEGALRESEKDYRRLVSEIPLAMVVIGEEGVIVSANAESARLLGARRIGDLIGRSMFDFILPENMQIVRQRVEKVLGERVDTENRETELVTLAGGRVQVEVRGIPVTFQGRKLGLSILRDVTESKKTEKALRESEQLYRHLVEAIPLAIMVVGEGREVVSANAEAAKLFKADRPEKLVGRPMLDFILPENREIVTKRMTATLEEGADAPVRDTELLAANGERIQVEASAIPFTYQGRKCALAIFRDIAESKRVSQMLLRYERLAAVGKVIAAIAHEVRNPLAVVSGMSQILKAKLETRSEYSQELETILTQAGRLKFFMNDILDYSRSMEIHKAPVNPRILFEESLLLAQAQLGAAQALTQVEWRMEAGLPDFMADADRLQQVLVNLILNAYQALDGKGTIFLSAKVKDGWMILGVEDDGPGIPEADMTRLFEPFFTTKKQGSGLGLSISQKIAEAHGGRIAIKRLSPRGSYFALQLPLETADQGK